MDTATEQSNGTKNGSSIISNPTKPTRKKRYLPSLPAASSAKDMQQVLYTVLVDRTPTEFASLDNYDIFSMSDDGSFPMIRISRIKAARLGDRKIFETGGGRVFRVTLQSHEIKNQNQGNS